MQLTKSQIRTILQNVPEGSSHLDVFKGLSNRGFTFEGIDPAQTDSFFQSQEPEEPKGLVGRHFQRETERAGDIVETAKNIGGTLKEAGKGIVRAEKDAISGKRSPIKAGFDIAASVAGGVTGVAGDIVTGIAKTLLPQETEDKIAKTFEGGVEKVIKKEGVQTLINAYSNLDEDTKQDIKTGATLGATLLEIATFGGARAVTPTIERVVKEAVDSIEQQAGKVLTTVGKAKESLPSIGKGTDLDVALVNITPRANELTPTDFKRLTEQNRIQPKTKTQPAQVILTEEEKRVAGKFSEVIKKDPVETTIGINNKIVDIDNEVGTFLKENDSIFNGGELRNKLTNSLEDISDLTVDEKRLTKVKAELIDRFVDSVKSKNMSGLWIARKEFDQAIETAFKGSPSVQKDIKKGLRNSVQEFIAEGTPSDAYNSFMADMRGLYGLRDTAVLKAGKEKSLSGLTAWAKENPVKAKALGIVAGGTLFTLFNPFD